MIQAAQLTLLSQAFWSGLLCACASLLWKYLDRRNLPQSSNTCRCALQVKNSGAIRCFLNFIEMFLCVLASGLIAELFPDSVAEVTSAVPKETCDLVLATLALVALVLFAWRILLTCMGNHHNRCWTPREGARSQFRMRLSGAACLFLFALGWYACADFLVMQTCYDRIAWRMGNHHVRGPKLVEVVSARGWLALGLILVDFLVFWHYYVKALWPFDCVSRAS